MTQREREQTTLERAADRIIRLEVELEGANQALAMAREDHRRLIQMVLALATILERKEVGA